MDLPLANKEDISSVFSGTTPQLLTTISQQDSLHSVFALQGLETITYKNAVL